MLSSPRRSNNKRLIRLPIFARDDIRVSVTGVNCEIDIDECASAPCRNGGQCRERGADEFECTCPDGFSGDLCELEAVGCAPVNPCVNGGRCEEAGRGAYR